MREREDGKPCFYGRKYQDHYRNEVENLQNCNSMFISADNAHSFFHGEMGNEVEFNLHERYNITRGKYNEVYARNRLIMLSNAHNRMIHNLYNKPENISKKKQCNFSDELEQEIQHIIDWEENCGDIPMIIRQTGSYVIDDCTKDLEKQGLNMITKDNLEITTVNQKFTDKMYEDLYEYCYKVTNNKTRFIKKDDHLESIRALYANRFKEQYITRRIEFIGFYWK